MKEITIISGKGGTGKTSFTAALAHLGSSMVLCDADVDAANLHLVSDPQVRESHVFEGSWVAEIDPAACTRCDLCTEYCRFDAIHETVSGHLEVQPYQCEGCRLCERICPSDAIRSTRSTANEWYVSETRFGTMVHAHMGAGEENSGKLVTQVRNTARQIATEQGKDYILTDGPPGTGCPVIASITGTDQIVLVVEPSQTSLHDAIRVLELARSFKLPVSAVINKWDLHKKTSQEIKDRLHELDVPILGMIPFDTSIVEALVHGKTISEFDPNGKISNILKEIWNRITHA